jgi:hypothetical protein
MHGALTSDRSKWLRLAVCVLLAVLVAMPLSAFGDVSAWFVPSGTKVLRDAKPNPQTHEGQLAAARNEAEACQLVLRSDRPVADVVVSVSELRLAGGSATLQPRLLKVEYVPNIVRSIAYPDPLPPLRPLALQPNQAQPVWISVKVPKEAKPGDYAGTVRLDAGSHHAEFPLRLHVWGFALPDAPSSVTAFGLSRPCIAQRHGVPVNSPESQRLYEAYYEMLLDHRISAYNIPVDLMSDGAAKYLNDPRMTSYMIPYPNDDAALKALVARLVKNGWYAKGYFYPIDEPVEKQAYTTLAKISDRLHECAPGYHWVVPFFRRPNWDGRITAFDVMANRVNIWCPNTPHFDSDATVRPSMTVRHVLGEKLWWYVCCGPGEPYNNFFVTMPALSHRVLFWQQKRENIEGLLYWETAWWAADVKDPWTDMATVKDINKNIRGDGSLFYPGKQVGVDGPVSSQRLEMIRDGLEDFEYLTLADAWLGKKVAQDFVASIARSMTDWERDPLVLEKVRRELGDLLDAKKHP